MIVRQRARGEPTTTCDDVWDEIRLPDGVRRYQLAHGCGHDLDSHTNGMKCHVCGRDCARADGQALDVEATGPLPVGIEPPDSQTALPL